MNADRVSAGSVLARWLVHMGSRWVLVFIVLAVVYGLVRVGREVVGLVLTIFPPD